MAGDGRAAPDERWTFIGASFAFALGGRWNLVVEPAVSWKISDEEFQVGLNPA